MGLFTETNYIVVFFCIPIFALMWVAVKLSSPGKFLFIQERPGLNDKTIKVYKVRTLKIGSEISTELGVNNSDNNVTLIGKVLRSLKLDELPQLINIVKGDMCFVGPRPIPIVLDKELRKKIPFFSRRYEVPPGLTSIGQICITDNGLGDQLVKDWKRRFLGELHYIRNRSVQYDLILMMMTGLYVLKILGKKLKS